MRLNATSPKSYTVSILSDLLGPVSFARTLRISSEGDLLFCNEKSNSIKVIPIDDADNFFYLEFKNNERISEFEPLTHNRILTLTLDGTLCIFDEEGTEMSSLSIFGEDSSKKEFTRCLSVSNDGKTIAVASYIKGNKSCKIYIFNISDKSNIVKTHEYNVENQAEKSEFKAMGFLNSSIQVNNFSIKLEEISEDNVKKSHPVLIAKSQFFILKIKDNGEIIKEVRNSKIDFTAKLQLKENLLWFVERTGRIAYIGDK